MFKKILAIAALIVMIIAFVACTTVIAEINGATNITYTIGDEAPNYLSGVSAKRGAQDVTSEITVDTSKVNLQTAGTYKIIYSVPNDKKAPTTTEVSIIVSNPADAVLSGVKNILYFLGDETPDYLEGISATRNGVNINDEIDIDYDDVDLTAPGEYTIIYTVENAETDTTAQAIVKVYEKSNYISTMLAEADYTGYLTQKMRAGISLFIDKITIPVNIIDESETLLEINNINFSVNLYSQLGQDTLELYASLSISTDMIYMIAEEERTPLFCLEGHFNAALKDGYIYIDSLWEIIDDQNERTNLSDALTQYIIYSDAPMDTKVKLLEMVPLFAPCKEKFAFSIEEYLAEGMMEGVLEEIDYLLSQIPELIYPQLFEGTIFDFVATENTISATYEGSLADIIEEYELP